MRIGKISNPVAQSLIDGILESAAAALDRMHRGAHQPHPEDVRLLSLHVDGAHVNLGSQPEKGASHSASYTVLPGSCFCDDPLLAHSLRQHGLAQSVVGFVSTTVKKIFAFQEDVCSPAAREIFGIVKGRWTPGIVAQKIVEL